MEKECYNTRRKKSAAIPEKGAAIPDGTKGAAIPEGKRVVSDSGVGTRLVITRIDRFDTSPDDEHTHAVAVS